MSAISLQFNPDLPRRLWLLDEGFGRLHGVIRGACERAHSLSSSIAVGSTGTDIRYYDVDHPVVSFSLYDTDTYPPDGYSGMFLCLHDFIPGPFGNLGSLAKMGQAERMISLHYGQIVHNPGHGISNVSQREAPRLRKSIFQEFWGFRADHVFRNALPTTEFLYSVQATDMSGSNPNVAGLVALLELNPVDVNALRRLPEYTRLLSSNVILSTENCRFYEQELNRDTEQWHGFVNVQVKTGFLSSEWQRVFLE